MISRRIPVELNRCFDNALLTCRIKICFCEIVVSIWRLWSTPRKTMRRMSSQKQRSSFSPPSMKVQNFKKFRVWLKIHSRRFCECWGTKNTHLSPTNSVVLTRIILQQSKRTQNDWQMVLSHLARSFSETKNLLKFLRYRSVINAGLVRARISRKGWTQTRLCRFQNSPQRGDLDGGAQKPQSGQEHYKKRVLFTLWLREMISNCELSMIPKFCNAIIPELRKALADPSAWTIECNIMF